MNIKKFILTIAIVGIVGSSFAQGGGQGRRGGFGMMGRGGGGVAQLLQREEVQTELKLTDDQKTKLSGLQQKMMEKMREMFQGGERPSQEKMRELFTKAAEDTQKEVDTILTPEQSKRLKELGVQRAGNMAVLNPVTAKELGLTEEQNAKIKTLQTKQGEANQAIGEKMRNGELEGREGFEKMQANQKVFDEELGKILTDAQKTKLKEMGGKPFTFAPDRRPGGGR
jgi:Spy/CpxP family protein refolding chaperone